MIELTIKSFNERAIVDDITWKFHAKVFNLARGRKEFSTHNYRRLSDGIDYKVIVK